MNEAFSVKNVTKKYGELKALDNVTLSAMEGKIFGLLGPNGAGKTTLVRLLSTLIAPDSGEAKVLGIDVHKQPEKVRRLIGLAGQFAAVDDFLTGRENMQMVGQLYQLSAYEAKARTNELLEKLSLSDAADRPVRTYSGGMRRRLDLGASLVGRPKMLFLDEPTTGLDPRTRLDLWAIIRELVQNGTTILLTTQYLEEADELADRIAVIDHGTNIAEGTSDELKSRYGGDVIEFQVASSLFAEKATKALSKNGFKDTSFDEQTLTVSVPVKSGGGAQLASIVRLLDSSKIEVVSLSLHRPSLDDVFLSLTGKRTSQPTKNPKGKK